VAGSTQNQQRIVDRGCCFGRVGPVIDQQRVVDLVTKKNKVFSLPDFFRKFYFFTVRIFRATKNKFWIIRLSMAP
jgi:hypothetical protein